MPRDPNRPRKPRQHRPPKAERPQGPTPDYPFYGPSTGTAPRPPMPHLADPMDGAPGWPAGDPLPLLSPAKAYNLSVWGTRRVPPPPIAAIRALARSHAPEAIGYLAEFMRDKSLPFQHRLEAIALLLDRGCGRPVTPVVGDEESPPLQLQVDLGGRSTEELRAELAELREGAEYLRWKEEQARTVEGTAAEVDNG